MHPSVHNQPPLVERLMCQCAAMTDVRCERPRAVNGGSHSASVQRAQCASVSEGPPLCGGPVPDCSYARSSPHVWLFFVPTDTNHNALIAASPTMSMGNHCGRPKAIANSCGEFMDPPTAPTMEPIRYIRRPSEARFVTQSTTQQPASGVNGSSACSTRITMQVVSSFGI